MAAPLAAQQKLIALTFDDGPRPYVLLGITSPSEKAAPGLLDLLDKDHAKATFFVVGWRLHPGSLGAWEEPKIGVTCVQALKEAVRRGQEVENHTWSHYPLDQWEKKRGAAWVLEDVERDSRLIQQITGAQPKFVRPRDWAITADMRRQLQQRGYHVMSIGDDQPLALRDMNTLDYLCAGTNPRNCPKPSLEGSVLHRIEEREKLGVYTHILAMHELTSTVKTLETLIPALEARGYRFVTLSEYEQAVRH